LSKVITLYKIQATDCGSQFSTLDKILAHFGVDVADSVGIKQFIHFGQLINGKCLLCSDPETFRTFDYGIIGN